MYQLRRLWWAPAIFSLAACGQEAALSMDESEAAEAALGPVVTWTAPLQGGTVQGVLSEANNNCRVTTNPTTGIRKVEFYLDGVLLNTESSSPWSCLWDTATAVPGSSHQLKAKAYDTSGYSGEAAITVKIYDPKPQVTWTAPVNGATVQGLLNEANANCRVDVTAQNTVNKVEFYLDSVLLNTESGAPWSCQWDTATAVPGSSHQLKAKAYDTAGNTGETAITVKVYAPGLQVKWTAPLEGGTVQGVLSEANANCRVDVTAQTSVSKVEFYLDGVLLNTESSAPWSCAWDTTTATPGSAHQLKAKAYDGSGNAGEAAIDVTVAGSPPPEHGLEGLSLAPSSGPVGTILVIDGSGFATGDQVELSAAGMTSVLVQPRSVAANQLTAVVPTLSVSAPIALKVRVRRGNQALPVAGLPFKFSSGKIRYISTTGKSTNSGTIDLPWPSIAIAAPKVGPGDLVYVRGGVYRGRSEIRTSGTKDSPLVFAGYPGEDVLIVQPDEGSVNPLNTIRIYGSYVTLDHLRLSNDNQRGQIITTIGMKWGADATGITISNCEIFNGHGQGIMLSGSKAFVYRNHIHHNGRDARFDHGIYAESGGHVIRSNIVHDNKAFGIHMFYGGGTNPTGGDVIEYNYVFSNGLASYPQQDNTDYAGGGIVIASNHPAETVRYNRICNNAPTGLLLIDNEPDALIQKNVFCHNVVKGAYLKFPGTGVKLDGNIFFANATGQGNLQLVTATNVVLDNDVYFTPSGSPQLTWGSTKTTLAGFQSASGQESHGRVADPGFQNVPATFDSSAALGYDFCNQFVTEFCSPVP